MKVIVSNIQRFCLQDGPGIRTTVFFKGCNLKCPWCSNPENIAFNIQEFIKDDEIGNYGYEMTLKELEEEILKDLPYYENNGGVTFSGGECLLQFDKIEHLLINLKEKNINICVETSLIVLEKFIDIALKYVDEFIIDIKILDENNIKRINGDIRDIDLYINNIKKIFKNKCKVTFRIPLVQDYIVTDTNMKKIYEFLKRFKPSKVEIFKIHRLGEKKYETLGKKMPMFNEINENQVLKIKEKIENLGIEVEYCKI